MTRMIHSRLLFAGACSLFLAFFVATATAQTESITVLYPNGGEVFTEDSTITIRWNASGFEADAEVEVEYSTDGGGSWRGIDRVTANAGQLSWNVRRVTETGLVRVSSRRGDASDVSDGTFQIIPNPLDATILFAPNGGEVLRSGEEFVISWQVPPDAVSVLLEYSFDFGISFTQIAEVPATVTDYVWTVPTVSDREDNVVVRVSLADAPDHFDLSDAPLSILPPGPTGALEITSPIAGTGFHQDETMMIEWQATNLDGDVSIELSSVASAGWHILGTAPVADGQFAWTVIDVVDENARIRVIHSDGGVGDTVAVELEGVHNPDPDPDPDPDNPGSSTLVVPNGSQVWVSGETREISWTNVDGGLDDEIEVSYRLRDTDPWVVIGIADVDDMAISWIVPDVQEEIPTVVVRISPTVEPVSPVISSPFTIRPRSASSVGSATSGWQLDLQ